MPEGFSKAPEGLRGIDLMNNPALKSFVGETRTPAVAQVVPPVATSVLVLPSSPTEDLPPEPPVKTAQELYIEALEEAKISMDEAAKIVDAQIMQGFYEEDVKITKKLTLRFRTRGQDAADRLNNEITKQNPSFNGVLYSLVAKYNLAASLVRYGPHSFDPSTDEGFRVSLDYITKKIPLPLYQLIVTKLAQFDEKLSLVMREAASSFF